MSKNDQERQRAEQEFQAAREKNSAALSETQNAVAALTQPPQYSPLTPAEEIALGVAARLSS